MEDKTENKYLILYKILLGLRFGLIVLPQTSIIHPDEFFQSVEVSAGNIFQIETVRTWEFSSDHPIRSSILILITALPFAILKGLSSAVNEIFHYSLTNSYLLLILPRLVMALLSLVIDYSVYNIIKLLNVTCDYEPLLVLASSYVSLVYYTRTLSNTLETALFAFLLLSVLKSLHSEKSVSLKMSFLNSQFSSTLTIIAVTITGVFNRPTFIVFALVPLSIWFFNEISVFQDLKGVLQKLFSIFSNSLIIISFLILLDSLYYSNNWLFSAINFESEVIWRSITITPWNFIKYNINPDNLANHGLHPFWLHVIVNFQILFGPVGLIAIIKLLVLLKRNTFARVTKLTNCFFALSLLVPLMLLSLFPHQEPRFLIPLLVPVAFLFDKSIWGRKWIMTLWLFFNFAGVLFFGFLHQGGIIPSLQNLSNKLSNKSGGEVIFFHTYMPPTHLLKVPLHPTKVKVTDLAGSSTETLQMKVSEILFTNEKSDVYLLSPASLHCSLLDLNEKYNLILVEKFYFHLSTEDFPNINDCNLKTNDFISSVTNILKQLSLNLYQIQMKVKTL